MKYCFRRIVWLLHRFQPALHWRNGVINERSGLTKNNIVWQGWEVSNFGLGRNATLAYN